MRIAIFSDIHGNSIVNVGSVSNPHPPDLWATYAVLDADQSGYQIEFKRVDYDREAVVSRLIELRHPGADWIIKHFRGQHTPFGIDWIQEQLRYLRAE